MLDVLATRADPPVVLAGDVNVHIERASDPHTVELIELLASYGLVQHATGATHDAGGTIDIVCTCESAPPSSVDIIDIDLSDHRLLRWSS